MAGLESDKVERALLRKMQAERREGKDWKFIIYNDQKKQISRTLLSKGAKHTLGPNRVAEMARQLGLETTKQFHDLVNCTLTREKALDIIERKLPKV
jgi:tRNA U34 2-thiouridine synthase MnmA/TrmU